MADLTPFDFIKSVSNIKNDIIKESDQPEYTENQYNGFIVNKGLSYFDDTILHANLMNMRPNLFKDAQYRYYLNILRKRNRFSKWHKALKNEDLDLIQQYYNCNRTVALQYMKVLTKENIEMIKSKMSKGG